MNTVETGYRKLNKTKLNNRKRTTITLSDSIENVTPIKWSKDVLNGTKKPSISICK